MSVQRVGRWGPTRKPSGGLRAGTDQRIRSKQRGYYSLTDGVRAIQRERGAAQLFQSLFLFRREHLRSLFL